MYACEPVGDSAAIVSFGNSIDISINRQVHQAVQVLSQPPLPGVVDMVPAYSSLTLYYNPAEIGAGSPFQVLKNRVNQRLDTLTADQIEKPGSLHTIPVCYEWSFSPDLDRVANHAGLSVDEVIARHSGAEYQVFFLGFLPGFPYLGGMDSRLAMPRKKTPEVLIPAGSVGIAGEQTGIYPLDSPGGWQIIGRIPVPLVDFTASPPAVLSAGDRLRFEPITADEFADWRQG